MTPEAAAKAKELVEKHFAKFKSTFIKLHVAMEISKGCSIVCVEEIIKSRPFSPHPEGYYEITSDRIDAAIEFWESVKRALEEM